MPWAEIAAPIAKAEDALARLDERLRASPFRDGWVARTHFFDAAASVWLDGALVSLEDLVLNDADMDIRIPTLEVTRANSVLRSRRRIAAAKPDWALTASGLAALVARKGERDRAAEEIHFEMDADDEGTAHEEDAENHGFEDDPVLDAALAALDAVMNRSEDRIKDARFARDPFLYDLDWNEAGRLREWLSVLSKTDDHPPVLAAALALLAWDFIEPLQHNAGLGRLLAAALLRKREKTQAHLACLNVGLRAIPYERRRARDINVRLLAVIEAIAAAATIGLAEHERWLTARTLLLRKTEGRRASSRLPALIDLVLKRPLVSTGMIADTLGVTTRAAQDLVAELGLREMTGRGRYRAWGIL